MLLQALAVLPVLLDIRAISCSVLTRKASYQALGCAQGPVGVPMDDQEAQQFAVTGPYAADFPGNQYAGHTHEQTQDEKDARLAGLLSKAAQHAWGSQWAPEVPDQVQPA